MEKKHNFGVDPVVIVTVLQQLLQFTQLWDCIDMKFRFVFFQIELCRKENKLLYVRKYFPLSFKICLF